MSFTIFLVPKENLDKQRSRISSAISLFSRRCEKRGAAICTGALVTTIISAALASCVPIGGAAQEFGQEVSRVSMAQNSIDVAASGLVAFPSLKNQATAIIAKIEKDQLRVVRAVRIVPERTDVHVEVLGTRVSEDGTTLGVLLRNMDDRFRDTLDAGEAICVVDLKSMRAHEIVTAHKWGGPGERLIALSPTGQRVLVFDRDFETTEERSYGRLWLYSSQGGRQRRALSPSFFMGARGNFISEVDAVVSLWGPFDLRGDILEDGWVESMEKARADDTNDPQVYEVNTEKSTLIYRTIRMPIEASREASKDRWAYVGKRSGLPPLFWRRDRDVDVVTLNRAEDGNLFLSYPFGGEAWTIRTLPALSATGDGASWIEIDVQAGAVKEIDANARFYSISPGAPPTSIPIVGDATPVEVVCGE